MTRQKSEDPVIPQGLRKLAPTALARGGKGIPVNEEEEQLGLPFATAGRSGKTRSSTRPKANVQAETLLPVTLETVIARLDEALDHVARNKGAPGSDGQRISDVRKDWPRVQRQLSRTLRNGTYRPGSARRKAIPKPGGGERALSIPNVVDRVVQQALLRCMAPLFEPDFSEHSHGFRPRRSCHTAVAEARTYVSEGHTVVVDMDLSKFFDRVNHQRLMARVERKVNDPAVLRLLWHLLGSTTLMPDGVVVQQEEGVPQGGPLSPLLSNIVLDELDIELDRRGHRFVRYADDVAVFVRSKRAGLRVMESITRFIEGRMRLKVNREKSAVRRPDQGNFLGFRLVRGPTGTVEIDLSLRTMKRAHARIRELTPRNWGASLKACAQRLNRYFTGWFGFFGYCTEIAHSRFRTLDARARRRIRAIQLAHWKRRRTIVRKLNRILYSPKVSRNVYKGRRGWWSLSHDGVVSYRLNTAWMEEQGLVALFKRTTKKRVPGVAPALAYVPIPGQLSLWTP